MRPHITVTVSAFGTEPDYDYVVLYDAFGYVGYLSGQQAAGRRFSTDSGEALQRQRLPPAAGFQSWQPAHQLLTDS